MKVRDSKRKTDDTFQKLCSLIFYVSCRPLEQNSLFWFFMFLFLACLGMLNATSDGLDGWSGMAACLFLWQHLKRLAVRYISPLVHFCHWDKDKSCPRLDRCHGHCCHKPPVIGTCGCRAFWSYGVREGMTMTIQKVNIAVILWSLHNVCWLFSVLTVDVSPVPSALAYLGVVVRIYFYKYFTRILTGQPVKMQLRMNSVLNHFNSSAVECPFLIDEKPLINHWLIFYCNTPLTIVPAVIKMVCINIYNNL